jgi:hypothetical protein
VISDLTGQNFTATLNTYTISGNAGDAGVILSYSGGTVTSAGNGRYSLSVPYGWSGTVTPSKSGLTFTPASRTYSGVTADQGGQDYLDSVTILSTGSQDGWILESAKGSKLGGSMNATAATFMLGDDAANRQYKAILSFNTAVLPDDAILQSAALQIKQSGTLTGKNPFSALGSLSIDVRKGFFGTKNALELVDFSAAASAAKAGTINKVPAGGWYSGTLTPTGINNINKISLTQLRLFFSKATNSNAKAEYMKFFSGNAPASSRPQLVITYTLP